MKNTMLALLLLLTALGCDKKDTVSTDTTPVLSINSISLLEGNDMKNFPFSVIIDKATDKAVTVNYTTMNGSAIGGTDFVAKTGVLTIAAGQTSGTIFVSVLGDTIRQPDKMFSVVLSNAVNANIGNGTATGTIRNDDTYVPSSADGYTSPLSYAGYTLVWHDEFDGSSIDPTNWKYDTGGGGWGNNELENYTNSSNNSYISGSKLVIEARKEAVGGSNYTSARLLTAGLHSFKYGRIDIRAKLPTDPGMWPALWMLGSNINTVGWPACGEMDIMELVGQEPNKVHASVHWGPNVAAHQHGTSTYALPTGTFSDKFHIFSVIWKENYMQYLVDEVPIYTVTPSSVSGIYPFNAEAFLIFNVAVGGDWPGTPPASTVFPQRMYVDYVRVFQ